VEIALAPVKLKENPFVLCIVRDVTHRYETEAALERARADLEQRVAERTAELREANRRIVEEQAKLIQAEKLSSIGLLASGVAHEINNPLSGVMGILRALEDDRLGARERQEFFDGAHEALERMRMTVQSLLDFARHRSPERERLDIAEVATACARLTSPAARRRNVSLELDLQPGDAHVFADRAQVMQALLNVVMNAIQAAPEGSSVHVSAATEGDRTTIRVEDFGPGIPAAIRGRVTDPFFTTKSEGEGTGLGLAVTIGILRAHGGDLEIDDREGGGARIGLVFPAIEDADA
jgi:signal transduction histidine kinase